LEELQKKYPFHSCINLVILGARLRKRLSITINHPEVEKDKNWYFLTFHLNLLTNVIFGIKMKMN